MNASRFPSNWKTPASQLTPSSSPESGYTESMVSSSFSVLIIYTLLGQGVWSWGWLPTLQEQVGLINWHDTSALDLHYAIIGTHFIFWHMVHKIPEVKTAVLFCTSACEKTHLNLNGLRLQPNLSRPCMECYVSEICTKWVNNSSIEAFETYFFFHLESWGSIFPVDSADTAGSLSSRRWIIANLCSSTPFCIPSRSSSSSWSTQPSPSATSSQIFLPVH